MPETFKKETLVEVFSCEYCKILKKTYFQEHLQTIAFLYGTVAHESETYDFTKLY